MNIKVLKQFILICEALNVEITALNLKKYKNIMGK